MPNRRRGKKRAYKNDTLGMNKRCNGLSPSIRIDETMRHGLSTFDGVDATVTHGLSPREKGLMRPELSPVHHPMCLSLIWFLVVRTTAADIMTSTPETIAAEK